jgi:hypothetical protein
MDYSNKLRAKITARNRVNAEAMRLAPLVQAAVTPLIGQKVQLANGEKSAKLKAAIAPFSYASLNIQVWFSVTYSLQMHVKTSEQPEGSYGCFYQEETVFLGDLNNGTLSKLYDLPKLRMDYTFDEITAARASVKQAREALRLEESKLVNFGEHDNH